MNFKKNVMIMSIRNTKHYIKTILQMPVFTAFVILCCVSCIDDGLFSQKETCRMHEAAVSIMLRQAPMAGDEDTRTVDSSKVDEANEAGHGVADVWLIEYDSNGNRVGNPTFIDLSENAESYKVNLLLPDSDDDADKFTLVALANTHDRDMSVALCQLNTLSDMEKFRMQFTDERCGYTTRTSQSGEGTDSHYLLLNGYTKLSESTRSIQVPLYRNVAKLSVSILNLADSGVEIKSVQLKSVASAINYADHLVKGKVAFGASYINLPTEIWNGSVVDNDSCKGEKMDLCYYIPRNMPGDNSSTTEADKNKDAPANATLIELKGVKKSDGVVVKYTFYVGKNMTNNFDIEPNHSYSLPIVISSCGTTTDSRVETLRDIDFDEANSYIVNYMKTEFESVQPMVSIPLDRINHFWAEDSLQNRHGDEQIYSETRWIAEVIWQDSGEDLFYFCDPSGKKVEQAPHFYEGKGMGRLRLRPTGNGTGNVLIGVRLKNATVDPDLPSKAGNGYLWSWHLWITDYVPETKSTMTDEKDVYPVIGGTVQRFDTKYWKNNNPSRSGICIMDRNYGAKKYKFDISGIEQYAGMYYYYGRKDPFPWGKNRNLYKYEAVRDAGGNLTGESMIGDQSLSGSNKFILLRLESTTVANAVRFPFVMYFDKATQHWCSETITTYNIYSWNDGDTRGKKHYFDPSPPGWRLPLKAEVPGSDLLVPGIEPEGCSFKLRTGQKTESGNDIYEYAFIPFSGSQRPENKDVVSTYWPDGAFLLTSQFESNGVVVWKGTASGINTTSLYIRLAYSTRMVKTE